MSTGMRKKVRAARPQSRPLGAAKTAGGAANPAPAAHRPWPPSRHALRSLSGGLKVAIVVGVAIAALALIFVLSNRGGSSAAGRQGGQYPYQVGKPGPGEPAPAINLPSTDGGTFDLAALRGQTVLLYFQEGIMCQPCWDQLRDIEARQGELQALGVDRIVSITTDPLDALRQKVANEKLRTPLLSDPGVSVSQAYEANRYGMMGNSMNGHSFVLVGPDGVVKWRADYGGAPNYTMYVPMTMLLADLRTGLAGASR